MKSEWHCLYCKHFTCKLRWLWQVSDNKNNKQVIKNLKSSQSFNSYFFIQSVGNMVVYVTTLSNNSKPLAYFSFTYLNVLHFHFCLSPSQSYFQVCLHILLLQTVFSAKGGTTGQVAYWRMSLYLFKHVYVNIKYMHMSIFTPDHVCCSQLWANVCCGVCLLLCVG